MFKMKMVNLTDHELAKHLNNIDKNWTFDRVGTFNRFIANGEVVAIISYDNNGSRKLKTFIKNDSEKSFKEEGVLVLKDIFK